MTAKLWTVANAIMLVLFVFSAVVQFNDPDAPAWIAVYAAAALLSGLEIRRSAPVWASLVLALVAFVWGSYIGRGVHDVPVSALFAEWEMKDLRIEEAREMYGLMIVGVWMTAIASVSWMRRFHHSTSAEDV